MHRARRLQLVPLALVVATLAAGAVFAQSPRERIARIPRADRERHAAEWHRTWRNPRVLVDRDAVYLLLGGKPFGEDAKPIADVAAALAALPRSAWPDGRIVALTKTPRLADDDALARVRELLDGLGVEIMETPVGCNCTN